MQIRCPDHTAKRHQYTFVIVQLFAPESDLAPFFIPLSIRGLCTSKCNQHFFKITLAEKHVIELVVEYENRISFKHDASVHDDEDEPES
jgi:hypothetical protein